MYHEFDFFNGDQTIRCLVSDLADCERIQNILDCMTEDRQEVVLAYMEAIDDDIEHAVEDVDNNDDICLYGYLNETLEEYARDLGRLDRWKTHSRTTSTMKDSQERWKMTDIMKLAMVSCMHTKKGRSHYAWKN